MPAKTKKRRVREDRMYLVGVPEHTILVYEVLATSSRAAANVVREGRFDEARYVERRYFVKPFTKRIK